VKKLFNPHAFFIRTATPRKDIPMITLLDPLLTPDQLQLTEADRRAATAKLVLAANSGGSLPAWRTRLRPAVFFADADVPAGVDAVGVFPADGTSARDLAKRLDLPEGVKAHPGDDRGVAEFQGIATSLPLIITSGVFGGMALVVSATIGLSVRQRRRELALLRASGCDRPGGRLITAAFTVLPIAMATRGWPLPAGPAWIVAARVAVVLLLVLPTTVVTGQIAMRAKPVDALSSPVG
jgi:hypothetical protein